MNEDTPEEVEARIRASIARDLADPKWRAKMMVSIDDARAGRVLPWRIAMLPMPRWALYVLFHWVAPRTWGRVARRALRERPE